MNIHWLIWDDWNREHISRHRIVQSEIEELIEGPYLKRKARSDCYMIFGRSFTGRYLMVVVAVRTEGAVYVVTAREMNKSEKKWFGRRI